MDFKKLISDIVTGNTKDLSKRFSLLGRRLRRLLYWMMHREKGKEMLKEIPVIINNRNRFQYLIQLINWLEKAGMKNIIILDNDSTYPPLLEYYKSTVHRVVYLGKNIGPQAIWLSGALDKELKDYYIYTDPDVVPDHKPDTTAIELMYKALRSSPTLDKVGYSLRIDDLPDHFELKNDVINWEKKFWTKPVGTNFFDAPVDTTFALYAPFARGGGECKALRTNLPYVAKHLPWYENSNAPDEESIYYRKNAASQNSHWTNLMNKA